MISKYLGIYEVSVNNHKKIRLFVTENLFGDDFDDTRRCFDLKGSLYGRTNKTTGNDCYEVLKDQNFLNQNKKSRVVNITDEEK